jgi:molybdopterin synthase catalytic subunit
MRVRVRLFASLREATGRSELEVELPEAASAEDAWKVLVAGHPALAGRRGGLTAAVNRRYVPFDHPLADGDEVVFVPPVSGGSTSFTAETRR